MQTVNATVTRLDNLVSNSWASQLANWVQAQKNSGALTLNRAGPHRHFGVLSESGSAPEKIFEIRKLIQRRLRIDRDVVEPMFGTMVSLIEPGGFVHEHTDPTKDGMRHLRANVLVRLPELGGMPVIDGERYEISRGSGWAFFASEQRHACDPVGGGTDRINLSFGFLVPSEYKLPQP